MYLYQLNIWNFRKYGHSISDGKELPGLSINFNEGLNLLVGENDSGKSCIIDSIKLILNTHSYEYLRITEDDFHINDDGTKESWMKIECIFKGFTVDEASNFLEWLGFDDEEEYELKVWTKAQIVKNEISSELRAGPDNNSTRIADRDGNYLVGKARDLLKVTYLKPLRDAQNEFVPKRGSRLSQILLGHSLFEKKDQPHTLEEIFNVADTNLIDYFENGEGKDIQETIRNEYLAAFSNPNKKLTSQFGITDPELKHILEKLEMKLGYDNAIDASVNIGLGSFNLLYMAVEFLHLKNEESNALKLGLIEEIEAHLHPQSQLRLIEFLEKESVEINIQLIITTHSPNLASKVDLNNFFLCKDEKVFPLSDNFTKLQSDDYEFLRRFLDTTKANLFFANGIIIVEGDAENLLIPAIADVIDKPLHKYGVSIVKVGSKALLRYAKIFHRIDDNSIGIPVACITDLDIAQYDVDGNVLPDDQKSDPDEKRTQIIQSLSDGQDVRVFISPLWTLEFDMAQQPIAKYLNQSIHLAKKIRSKNNGGDYSGLSNKEEAAILTEADEKYEEIKISNGGDKKIAWEIFKPLKKNNASKAITAQYLAKIILENKATLKDELQKATSPLKYIVDAIKYVTKE